MPFPLFVMPHGGGQRNTQQQEKCVCRMVVVLDDAVRIPLGVLVEDSDVVSATYRCCSCAKMPHFLSLLGKQTHSWWCHMHTTTVGVPAMCTQWNMKLLTLLTSTKPVWTEEGFHPSAVFCSSFVLQIVSAHTHSYTHATQWCRCSEGKDALKYFRNRLAAERNMKLMKGTAERQSRKGSSVRWKELGLFDDEW